MAPDPRNPPNLDPTKPPAPADRQLPRAQRLESPPDAADNSPAAFHIETTDDRPGVRGKKRRSPKKDKKARPAPPDGARADGGLVEAHEDEPEDLAALVVKESPAWLVSALFNMTLLIVLALWVFQIREDQGIRIIANSERIGEQLLLDIEPIGFQEDLEEDLALTESDLPPVLDPDAAAALLDPTIDGTTALSERSAPVVGLDFRGREAGSRQSLLKAYGGTKATQAAVEAGLKWLAGVQLADGSWSLGGPEVNYPNGAFQENRVAATAMALLAFQGNGNTPDDGPYKKNVDRAWRWLLRQQGSDGCFFQTGIHQHRFYTHGQCTIAICELYGMTRDSQYRGPAELAVDYCIQTQAREGGWKYEPGIQSDTSVTGWILMGLQSARMAGLAVPDETLAGVTRFLNSVQQEDGSQYSYDPDDVAERAMTAEGLLCRQYLGWPRDDSRLVRGVEYLLQPDNLLSYAPGERNVYYWYYASQVMHHMEGSHWQRWNEVMRVEVPKHQVASGKQAGSWDPENPAQDRWASYGGRLYVTCLSIYMLEVYYRHLPIYSKVYTYIEKL